MSRGYILIDGSALFASIGSLWRSDPKFNKRKLNLTRYRLRLNNEWMGNIDEIIRICFYFKRGDSRIEKMLNIPDIGIQGIKDHWQIIECGEPVKTIPEIELQKIDEKYRDQFSRAEKGLDTRITCDALVAATTGRASEFVFLTNDRDFIPVFESIQRFGCCVYLTSLTNSPPQNKLLNICDKYLHSHAALENLFNIKD